MIPIISRIKLYMHLLFRIFVFDLLIYVCLRAVRKIVQSVFDKLCKRCVEHLFKYALVFVVYPQKKEKKSKNGKETFIQLQNDKWFW